LRKVWVITLFPEYFKPLIDFGVTSKGLNGDLGVTLELINLKIFSLNSYGSVDDSPVGGGPGMVMRADCLRNALLQGVVNGGGYGEAYKDHLHVVLTGPRGRRVDNKISKEFAEKFLSSSKNCGDKDVVFICGRYEGVDERFVDLYVDEEISIGDFVLSGGEIAVMALLDSALRFVPSVLGNSSSVLCDSFEDGLLDHPQYTKPRVFEDIEVPEILYSGHHANIEKYKREERLRVTKLYRKDLLEL